MNGILARVAQLKEEMTKKERDVADALLAEPNAVVSRSITEYAVYVSSSTATITRFCKHLGISGFAELKLSVANSLNDERCQIGRIDKHVDLESAKTTEDVIKAVVANAFSSVEQLHKLLTPELLEKAAVTIASARNVLLTGIGASSLVAMDLHQKLTRLGVLSHYDTDLDLQRVQISSFDERDVVVAFSYSGMKKEVRGICRLAKEKGARIVAVTKQGQNPISELADIHLPVVPLEAVVREGATVSRLQMLVVVDCLFQLMIRSEHGVFETLVETWANVSRKKSDKL